MGVTITTSEDPTMISISSVRCTIRRLTGATKGTLRQV